MYHRRRRSTSTTPPSTSALIAATTVYHPSLAAAAAGTALRHTPTPQPIGTIPTKRMLKRRDSYSTPSASDTDTRPIHRRVSSGSLTDRRFRKGSPARRASVDERRRGGSTDDKLWSTNNRANMNARSGNTDDTANTNDTLQSTDTRETTTNKPWRPHPSTWSDTSNDGDDDSITSARSFPTTLRGPIPKKHQKSASGSILSRGSLRSPSPSTRRPRSSDPPKHTTYTPSVHSTASELESILEHPPLRNPPSLLPRSTTPPPPSPSRTTFYIPPSSPSTPPKHSPPPRSVSPAKSALKQPKPRVSFSDEDSTAPSLHLPVWVPAPSPPPSDTGSERGIDDIVRFPRGMPPLGAGGAVKRVLEEGGMEAPLRGVPVVRVVAATPSEEIEVGLGDGGVKREGEKEGEVVNIPGGFPEDPDSDSGDSIYSDAYEDLTLDTTFPNILEVVPLSAVRERPSSTPAPIPAPAPAPPSPEFLQQRRHSTPVPVSISAPQHSPSSSVSELSESSFTRERPRREREGMRRSMRAPDTGRVSKSRFSEDSEDESEGEVVGVVAGVGFRSRWEGDSDDEVEVGEKVVRRMTDGGVVGGGSGEKKKGFWKGFTGKGKGKGKVVSKKVEVKEGGKKKRFKGLRKLFGGAS